MAAAVQEPHHPCFHCMVCTNLYKDPCTLICGHTFCRECVLKYTKTQRDAIKAKFIRCPNCRKETYVSTLTAPVEEWVNQIKPGFLIQELVDEFFSEQSGEKGPETRTPDSPHYKNYVGVQRAISASLWGRYSCRICEAKEGYKRKVICRAHNRTVDFCCKDCTYAVCEKCWKFNHRKCKRVVPLESIVSEMKAAIRQNKEVVEEEEKSETASIRQRSNSGADEAKNDSVEAEVIKLTQGVIRMIQQGHYDEAYRKDKGTGDVK